MFIEKEEVCPDCNGELDQQEYDFQFHRKCGWRGADTGKILTKDQYENRKHLDKEVEKIIQDLKGNIEL
jgi:hypothetical protein